MATTLKSKHRARIIPLLVFVALVAKSPAQETVFHSVVHLVTLTFSVRNTAGQVAPGLNADDFVIYEDGVPQTISSFAREDQLPLSIGLLVDVSDSQSKFIKQHLKDVESFLDAILRPQDQAFAICFGDHIRVVSDLTAAPAQVVDGLKKFDKSGGSVFPELAADPTREGGTALYDAVVASIDGKLTGIQGRRRALILFTDGEENSSAHDEMEAVAAAQDADVLVYAVRYTETHHGQLSAHNRQGIAALHHLAGNTGGTDFDALHTNLPEAFRQIAEELRSLYSISYHSTNKASDGSFRKVVVEAKPEGLTVRAKSGYYAR
jgi:Ca-activated chloride channel homolog